MLHSKRRSSTIARASMPTWLVVCMFCLAPGCGDSDQGSLADQDAGRLADGSAGGNSDGSGDQAASSGLTYPINDTEQTDCYNDTKKMTCPAAGAAFYGQDGNHGPGKMSLKDNGDGTVSDLNTGLMWVKAQGTGVTFAAAKTGAKSFKLAGHSDWRFPSLKEMYSLIHYNGGYTGTVSTSVPYIDTKYFSFAYNTATGERLMDVQYATSNEYVGTTMNGNKTVFGVNFADGRIKGYPSANPKGGADKLFFVKYVRGNTSYGKNSFTDNKDGTISDKATGLTWQQGDNGKGMVWKDALAYCEALKLAGKGDWRLPNTKELQSIVDYTRAPLVTKTAAIDPVFKVTEMESYYWTGTTHNEHGKSIRAVYIAFGQALGYMEQPPGSGKYTLLDVHGAGAQRSDPKTGDPSQYPQGFGPQGDVIRIYNYARCVRGK